MIFKPSRKTRAIASIENAKYRENEIQEEANGIAREEAKTNAERLEFEKATKDRVDISLKEYEQLKKDIEQLKKDIKDSQNESLMRYETLMKIVGPLLKMHIDEETISKIVDGKFDCKVQVFQNGIEDPLQQKWKLAVIYEIDAIDLRR